jgi:hypothetical protein
VNVFLLFKIYKYKEVKHSTSQFFTFYS